VPQCWLAGAGAAQANIMIYTRLSNFNTVTSARGFDTYDDLILHQFSGSPLTRSADVYSYNVSSSDGLFGAGNPGDAWPTSNTLADPILFFNFSSGVMAFGGNFFTSDVLGLFSPVGHFALTALDSTGIAVSY
jgi:hypothetical protein